MGAARRFFAPQAARCRNLRLDAAETHHLLRVLRLGPGAEIEVFDGAGNAFSARVVGVDGDAHSLVERGMALPGREPGIRLAVGVAIPKGDGLTAIVRQLAEIGADTIMPLTSERSEGRATAVRLTRWRAAALSGTRQSGRAAVPTVAAPVPFEVWIRGELATDRWIASPPTAQTVRPGAPAPQPVTGRVLAVGPEGGFSARELEHAHRHGFRRLDLGERILRTGTAAVVAAALLLRPAG
ncbi:MAG: 16S rRNA (uracil(1498)-N(3))-methyltransferase [Acidobacteriota bacterium]|nr:16S rRNA (uracil(1498)-N(3))-methyltransferase [Acidobacteriota bacterium]